MPSRYRRRATAALIAALTITLSAPLAAQAGAEDGPALPDLDSASSLEPRGGAESSRFRPLESAPAASARSGSSDVAPLAASVPEAVSEIFILEALSTRARIQWSAPSDGGSPITGYHLQLLQGDSVIDEVVWTEPMLGVSLLELMPDTAYAFRVAAVNAEGTGEFSAAVDFTTAHSSVERIYGADRYETAAAVSADAFPFSGLTAAFVANGRNFPDALSAAAAAGALDGPVLLTPANALAPATAAEVAALAPQYVVVAGGPAVVGDAVLNQLTPLATTEAFRVGGRNRYDTAGQMSGFWESPSTVYLANGTNYPDALAGAAAAGFTDAPVLLTTRDVLPADTIAALQFHQPTRIIALGGTGSINDSVLKKARLSTGVSTTTTRLSGLTRYDTAAEVSRATFVTPRVPIVYVASGLHFADGLAGAAAGGSLGGPMLLTKPAEMPPSVIAEIQRLDPVRVVVLGGPAVVSEGVAAQISDALAQD